MAEARTRDRIWIMIMQAIRKGNDLTVRRVVEKESCAERTARDVLQVAAENAYLLNIHEEETGRRVYRPKVTLEQRDERADGQQHSTDAPT